MHSGKFFSWSIFELLLVNGKTTAEFVLYKLLKETIRAHLIVWNRFMRELICLNSKVKFWKLRIKQRENVYSSYKIDNMLDSWNVLVNKVFIWKQQIYLIKFRPTLFSFNFIFLEMAIKFGTKISDSTLRKLDYFSASFILRFY